MLKISVNPKSGVPIYVQIINQVEEFASGGVLKAGDPLPTIRSLASELEVNPNTVARAYRDLETQGILISRRGVGTCVADGVQSTLDGEVVIRERLHDLVAMAERLGVERVLLRELFEEAFRSGEPETSETSETSEPFPAVSVEFID